MFPAPARDDLWLLYAILVGFDHLLDHLAADGAGLTAGEIAVVTVFQVNADLSSGLHLEPIHGGASLRDIDPIGLISHCVASPFVY